ncbi:electron transfer flavoprotein [Halobacteriales archaeon SW_8_68_21]|nr:MAG: electron transfer flavoprotein [Halobacteriales archaeon SW_8_68_21]
MYDFAVVGAGPPGSRFARRAAEAGRDVVAFEKGSVGEPLACSGHVSDDVWEYVPDDAREELLQNRVYGARFHVDGPGSRAYPFYKHDPVSNVIDRVGLDRTLADHAREAGADVRESHTVVGVEERSDRVVVEVRTPADEVEEVEARMVAGCDGPTSRVRRAFDLPEPEELLHGVLGFDGAPDAGDLVDVHLTAPTFFAWRIPRGDAGVEYGLAAPPSEDVSAGFDRLTDAYDATTERRCSGAIPIGPPARTTSDRGFLIAGWREELATEIRFGKAIRRCYSLPEPVQHVGLRALSGEIGVHMDEPSSFFSASNLRALFSRGEPPN